MENINWQEIKKWLDGRADCDYDVNGKAYPNKYMRALTAYEDWQSKLWVVSEEDVINEVLEIIEELPDRDDYNELIYKLNRRYFEMTEIAQND
jgi:hypothetical protein